MESHSIPTANWRASPTSAFQSSTWVSLLSLLTWRLGLRFDDDVYYFISQGLLDPHMMEQIAAQKFTDSNVLAPSYLTHQTLENPEYLEILAIAFRNLSNNY